MFEVGFIGCGNMGAALARAAAGVVAPAQILLANRTAAKAEALAEELGAAAGTNEQVAVECRYLFLGVKPNLMAAMLEPLQSLLAARAGQFMLVSMAAGLTVADIQVAAGGAYPVARIMPNLPVAVGEGMLLACLSEEAAGTELAAGLVPLLEATGRVAYLPEEQMDAATAVAGSGPAFACLFMDALAEGGAACGLPRKAALEYAAQMMLGTATLVLAGEDPAALKERVCSPGGTTIAGVGALEEGAFAATTQSAVNAAFMRAKELR